MIVYGIEMDSKSKISKSNQKVSIENPYEPGGYMDDDEDDGYRK